MLTWFRKYEIDKANSNCVITTEDKLSVFFLWRRNTDGFLRKTYNLFFGLFSLSTRENKTKSRVESQRSFFFKEVFFKEVFLLFFFVKKKIISL